MNPSQMQSPNRRWPKPYESWAQRSRFIEFVEQRGSKFYPLTHYPYDEQTYTAYGSEYNATSSHNDLTTYVR